MTGAVLGLGTDHQRNWIATDGGQLQESHTGTKMLKAVIRLLLLMGSRMRFIIEGSGSTWILRINGLSLSILRIFQHKYQIYI